MLKQDEILCLKKIVGLNFTEISLKTGLPNMVIRGIFKRAKKKRDLFKRKWGPGHIKAISNKNQYLKWLESKSSQISAPKQAKIQERDKNCFNRTKEFEMRWKACSPVS